MRHRSSSSRSRSKSPSKHNKKSASGSKSKKSKRSRSRSRSRSKHHNRRRSDSKSSASSSSSSTSSMDRRQSSQQKAYDRKKHLEFSDTVDKLHTKSEDKRRKQLNKLEDDGFRPAQFKSSRSSKAASSSAAASASSTLTKSVGGSDPYKRIDVAFDIQGTSIVDNTITATATTTLIDESTKKAESILGDLV